MANFSTDETGSLIISGPKTACPKETRYRKLASDKSAQNSCSYFRPSWRPSASSPKSLTPHHKLQWLAPPPSDIKPWARRKPPSSYLVEVCRSGLVLMWCRQPDPDVASRTSDQHIGAGRDLQLNRPGSKARVTCSLAPMKLNTAPATRFREGESATTKSFLRRSHQRAAICMSAEWTRTPNMRVCCNLVQLVRPLSHQVRRG